VGLKSVARISISTFPWEEIVYCGTDVDEVVVTVVVAVSAGEPEAVSEAVGAIGKAVAVEAGDIFVAIPGEEGTDTTLFWFTVFPVPDPGLPVDAVPEFWWDSGPIRIPATITTIMKPAIYMSADRDIISMSVYECALIYRNCGTISLFYRKF